MNCIQRNGDVTSYSVRYWSQGSGSKQTKSILGGATTEGTISELKAATTYSIEVAAVNSIGTGVYSNLTTMTLCKFLFRQNLFKTNLFVVTHFMNLLLHNKFIIFLNTQHYS